MRNIVIKIMVKYIYENYYFYRKKTQTNIGNFKNCLLKINQYLLTICQHCKNTENSYKGA